MTAYSRDRHLLTLLDWDAERIGKVLARAASIKRDYKTRGASDLLKGRSIAMIFEKPSLRTRVTFEAGMAQLGGQAMVLSPDQVGLGKRETVEDAAKSLSRWVDAIVARTFSHGLVEELALHSAVPVVNALTDLFHPCQALAFAQSLIERRLGAGRAATAFATDAAPAAFTAEEAAAALKGAHLVFVGDGNNVANSLAVLAGFLGMDFTLACPEGFEQPAEIVNRVTPLFQRSGGRYRVLRDPKEAARSADVLYTDVWVSMGEEAQEAEKKKAFARYQVNADLLAAAPAHCGITHCLPAHRGEEITAEMMASPRNFCFEEAENRLHAQKAVLLTLLAGNG